MKAKLTINKINNLQPKSKPYEARDTDIKGFLCRVQPSGNKSYYLAYTSRQDGKRKRYLLGKATSMTATKARKQAEKLYADIVGGKDLQENKKQTARKAKTSRLRTLKRFINPDIAGTYGEYVMQNCQSKRSGQETLRILNNAFSEFLDYQLADINHWLVDKWRHDKLKTNKPETVNRKITALKACLQKSVEYKLIKHNPLVNLKPIKTDKNKIMRLLSGDELLRLREVLNERDNIRRSKRKSANEWRAKRKYDLYPEHGEYSDHVTPVVLLAVNTGMRQGEIFILHWNDVNLNKKQLTVQGKSAKSGQTRQIPLNIEACNILQAWQKQASYKGFVFPHKSGKPLQSFKKAWRKILDEANLKNVRFHDLRHTFASLMLARGADLETCKSLLGHADISTTARYLHTDNKRKQEAVELINIQTLIENKA